MTTYFLKCLGIPRLSTAGGSEVRLQVRKHLALLVFLAVERQARHRRERLVDLFWPEGQGRAGRQSLANALSVFRAKLGHDVIQADRDFVRLGSGHLHLDLDRLEAGDIVGNGTSAPLEAAGFLEDFELPGLPEFQHWRDQQQARLLPAIHRGLLVLADLARRTGDLKALGHCADRLLAISDLSEDGIRARMQVAALSGDRISALRIFETWASRLEAELGARPSADLDRMAMRLRRRGWDRPADSDMPTVITEHWQDRDFIGRAREYRVLYDQWERVRTGTAGHVAIVGGPGVGKTTLADRFVMAVALEGAITTRARCFELERGIPYAMIRMLIEGLLDRPGASSTDPAALAELARMVPEVRRRHPGIPSAPETQGESARVRFADAAADLFRALLAENSLVLQVDDFHQADEVSLAVLHMAMRQTRDLPMMVVLTARPELPGHGSSAFRMLQEAEHLGLSRLDLGPMPPDESAALLDALLARSSARLNQTERHALLRAAAGYPLALELLVRSWERRRSGDAVLTVDAMTVDVTQDPDETYRRLAESSLERLAATERMVLQVAAVLDRRLNEIEMYSLVDLAPPQTMAKLAALAAHGALRDISGTLEFAHPAIRAHAYLSMPASLRRLVHANVVTRLLERKAGGEAIPGLEIAWHGIRAGMVEKAIPHLLAGAQEALNAGAPQEAELALTSGLPLMDDENRDAARMLLVEVLYELGRYADCLAVLEQLSDRAREREADLIAIHSAYARHRLGVLEEEDVGALFSELQTQVKDSSKAPAARTKAAVLLGELAGRSGRTPSVAQVLTACRSLDPKLLSPPDQVLLHYTFASMYERLKTPGLPLEHLELAHSAAIAANIRNLGMARVHGGFSATLIGIGEYEKALSHALLAYDRAAQLGNWNYSAVAVSNVALCYGRLGDYQSQYEWACRVEGIGFPDLSSETRLHCLLHRAFGAAMMGDLVAVQVAVQELGAFTGPDSPPWMRQRALLASADAFLILGREKSALTLGRSGLSKPTRRLTMPSLAGAYARWCSILAVRRGALRASVLELEGLTRSPQVQLDAIDRVEVGLAIGRLRQLTSAERNVIQALLAQLPQAVTRQMEALRPQVERNRPLLPAG